ncbi:hypothetical protein GV828_03450 [Flavobacterium sp. NST-5]|uniref:Heme biosynthesis protein HemY n=1 Tax=Flavobacterium ichthyis TaxID=2698827 RepID=A0ABW9Z6H3_9FLAO|nr:hypothetical protein [Flavobacterium ichthyis]NBL64254.1 hypothetical protein [Flavobacterium ichthyis]
MKRITLAIATVLLVISGFAIPGRFADHSSNLNNFLLKVGFTALFIVCLLIIFSGVISFIRMKRYNGIRTIRQYYLQRSTR